MYMTQYKFKQWEVVTMTIVDESENVNETNKLVVS